jgi:Rrf2 family protein
MQVTKAVDYGLRALVQMALKPLGTRFFLQELSDAGELPRNYLVKVLKSLANAGIVRSYRGIKGGFSLGRSPAEISIRQIVEAIDGPVSVMHCLTDPQSCRRLGMCATEHYFRQLREEILGSMETQSLAGLITLQLQINGAGSPCSCENTEPA